MLSTSLCSTRGPYPRRQVEFVGGGADGGRCGGQALRRYVMRDPLPHDFLPTTQAFYPARHFTTGDAPASGDGSATSTAASSSVEHSGALSDRVADASVLGDISYALRSEITNIAYTIREMSMSDHADELKADIERLSDALAVREARLESFCKELAVVESELRSFSIQDDAPVPDVDPGRPPSGDLDGNAERSETTDEVSDDEEDDVPLTSFALRVQQKERGADAQRLMKTQVDSEIARRQVLEYFICQAISMMAFRRLDSFKFHMLGPDPTTIFQHIASFLHRCSIDTTLYDDWHRRYTRKFASKSSPEKAMVSCYE